MNVRLLRIGSNCGVLFLDNFPLFTTLESDEWKIPAGTYPLRRVESPKFGECFTVCNVPGHDLLRIHWGNTEGDTTGCILVGLQFGKIRLQSCVWRSREAFEQFMEALYGIAETEISIEGI